jgi:hypothetical protein
MNTVKYVGAIDTALDGIEEMTAILRDLADAGTKIGDALTNNIDLMTREERFDEAMKMWRQLSKVGNAISWLELHARAARRNTNSLLSELSESNES